MKTVDRSYSSSLRPFFIRKYSLKEGHFMLFLIAIPGKFKKEVSLRSHINYDRYG